MEICLALALFSFSVISVVAILSVALDTYRESQRESTLTSIMRGIDSDVRSAYDAAAVTALSASNRYYDVAGKAVTNAADIYYTVKLTPVADKSVGTALSLEQSTNVNLWSARISYLSSNSPPVNMLFGRTRPAL